MSNFWNMSVELKKFELNDGTIVMVAGNEVTWGGDNKRLGSFIMTTLDGNCGICHIFNWRMSDNKDTTALFQWLDEYVKAAGYTIIMTGLNEQQDHIAELLVDNGWKQEYSFMSRRTYNLCITYRRVLELSPGEIAAGNAYRTNHGWQPVKFLGDGNAVV